MRKLITMTLMTLGLTGGVAMADPHYDNHYDNHRTVVTDHREVREVHYRDYHARPAVRYERHDERRGFRWVGGEWRWNRYEWIWAPGHYVRIGW